MNKLELIVDRKDLRLDIYLSEEVEALSRSEIKNLIKNGHILVNGQKGKPSYKVRENDIIHISRPEEERPTLEAEDLRLDVVYEDDYIAVINKPKSMVVHPGAGNPSSTLVNGLLYRFENLSDFNGPERPGIVHRLDKDTSGLLVIAKDNKSHKFLAEQFKARTVKRVYRALVFGRPSQDNMRIESKIGRHPVNRQKMAVVDQGRRAITNLSLVEAFNKYSLLELSLETGRTHQIRVHMNHINHPIVGDQLYSKGKNEFGLDSQFLYAYKLGFIHPATGQYVEFQQESPIEEYSKILRGLRNRRDF